MTEEITDFVVILQGRDPIHFSASIDNPVLQQLCWALANRDQLGARMMNLELQDSDTPYVYFPVSSLVSIEAGIPLPDDLFEGSRAVKTEDFLHLNMDTVWVEWAIQCLERGVDKTSIFERMRKSGVDMAAICELLEYSPTGLTLPLEHQDRETILPLTGPQALQKDRYDNDYIELYVIEDILTLEQCAEIISSVGENVTRSRVYSRKDYYEGRTSNSYFFPNHRNPVPVTQALQDRIAAMLELDVNSLEPLHFNIYTEGQQFRSHTDFFRDNGAKFISRDGVERYGQRQWSIAIYLNAIDRGSGIRFPIVGIEFDPKPGTAIVWNNLYPSGNPNPYSLHEGLRAGKETKYMLAQFSRIVETS